MRHRVVLAAALAARAQEELQVIIEPHIYEKLEQQVQIIDAEKLFREEKRDIRHNTVRMRHFHDNQNKVKRFRK